ncbi:MAG TPA: histidine phosphatase family protein [Clostridia bacterium]|nr:histidine phosphatase family protein [Clostridia bacterium]
MKLLIIRHGESEADILKVHEGRADFELTEKGKLQAEEMAKWINKNFTIEKIYASTLKRAKQTAEALSNETRAEIDFRNELMEFNNGLLAGLPREEAESKYPRILNLPVHKSVYEMESALEFRYRAEYILSVILSENNTEATIAIVSHGGMINQLFHSFLSLPVDSNIHILTGDTGIHLWQYDEKERCILFSNKTEHLSVMSY